MHKYGLICKFSHYKTRKQIDMSELLKLPISHYSFLPVFLTLVVCWSVFFVFYQITWNTWMCYFFAQGEDIKIQTEQTGNHYMEN